MPAEAETRRASWLMYATSFAVVLPVLYVLSSGPAQCIERNEAGFLTIGQMFVGDDLSIPFRQGGLYSRWTSPLREIFSPLDWLSMKSSSCRILTSAWG